MRVRQWVEIGRRSNQVKCQNGTLESKPATAFSCSFTVALQSAFGTLRFNFGVNATCRAGLSREVELVIMQDPFLEDDAEACRQLALCYLGRPEASFLLRAAREFDQLAKSGMPIPRLNLASHPSILNNASDDLEVDGS